MKCWLILTTTQHLWPLLSTTFEQTRFPFQFFSYIHETSSWVGVEPIQVINSLRMSIKSSLFEMFLINKKRFFIQHKIMSTCLEILHTNKRFQCVGIAESSKIEHSWCFWSITLAFSQLGDHGKKLRSSDFSFFLSQEWSTWCWITN